MVLGKSGADAIEQARLMALRKLKILDSPFEIVFDTITQLASDVCEKSISLISLIDEERQWFKSNVGMEGITETPRGNRFLLAYHTGQ